jgi:lipid-A-disaccharide synthase
VISAAASVDLGELRRVASETLQGDSLYFKIASASSMEILANSDFGLVKSGTSTLEAALAGNPFLIIYKISPVSWYVGNILIRSPFKGLVNLIGREEIVPELMQDDATPESLSKVALEYLRNPERAASMRSRLAEIRARLGSRCASDTAAAAVARYLE